VRGFARINDSVAVPLLFLICIFAVSGGKAMKNSFSIPAIIVYPILLMCFIVLVPAYSSAFVPEDLEQLKKTKKCPGCDLRGADLRGVDLSDANLEGVNLMGANLEGVKLEDATLDDASLEDANLRNARLHGASMDHAGIEGAVLLGADLQDVTWIDGKVCKKGSIGICK